MEASGLASGVLAACIDQVTMARECAMLGEYATALVYFEGVLDQLGRSVERTGRIAATLI